MNTIHCRIKLNDHADVAGKDITPAEVIVLRHLHDKHAGGCCIKKPRQGSRALMRDVDGKTRARTSIEEYQRLRVKYPQRSAPDKPNSSFLDDLFPGVRTGAAKLPERFEDLAPEFALKEEIAPARERFVRTPDTFKETPVSEEEAQAEAVPVEVKQIHTGEAGNAPQEDLASKTVAELKEIAADYGLEIPKQCNKAKLLEMISGAEAGKPSPSPETEGELQPT